jgi:hypothetical protein
VASRKTRTLLLGAALTLVLGLQFTGGPAFAGQPGETGGPHTQTAKEDHDKSSGAPGTNGLSTPGNRGVVKIDDVPFDDHPNNEPHVGCVFEIDLTGFAIGHAPVGITFSAHSPTTRDGDDQVLSTDELSLTPGTHGAGASETYTLDFEGISPHDKQGYHVKLTVDTGQGAGKHKVFWVEGCGTQPTESTTPGKNEQSTTTTTEAPSGGEGQHGSTTTSTTAATPVDRTSPPTTLLVAGGAGGQTPGGGSELPFTGTNAGRLAMIGALLLLAGLMVLRSARLRAAPRQADGGQPPTPRQ